jgi:hypothetical protein
VYVHDGDSVEVCIDRGFDDTSQINVRLKDVWAPELADIGGRETRDFVLGWLMDHGDGSRWSFALETFRTPRSDVETMTFNRYVGVLTAPDGTSLNAAVSQFVLEKGYAGGIGA